MDKAREILKPFSESDQKILKVVDQGCRMQAKMISDEDTRAKLAGEPLEVTPEVAAWRVMIRGFGILYNRAVDAGWVDDVITTKEVIGR